jgi:arsenate reductase
VNPVSNFAAVMTCSHADENCPFILGTEMRIPVMYEDPKLFDHTVLEKEKYRERSLQIAAEMKYVFSKIKLNEKEA